MFSQYFKRTNNYNMKQTELKGLVKFFSVDLNSIDNNDIIDIHR